MFVHHLGHRLELTDKTPRASTPVDIIKCRPSIKHLSYVDGKDDEVDASQLPTLEVRRSSGRGLGLFTQTRVKAYTEILNDTALLSLALGEDTPQLWQKYSTLPGAHRKIFDELSYPELYNEKERVMIAKLRQRGHPETEARNMARVSSIFLANAFKTSSDPEEQSRTASTTAQTWAHSLFPTMARLNHSCIPNSHSHYNIFTGARSVYALHDIEAGTELEISYFDLTMPLAQRQQRTQDWAFQCTCPACAPTSTLRRGGYENHIAAIHNTINTNFLIANMKHAEASERDVRKSIQAAHHEKYPWLVAALPMLYSLLFQRVYMQFGFTGKAREDIFEGLECMIEWQIKLTGRNSDPTRQCRRRLHEWKATVGADQTGQ